MTATPVRVVFVAGLGRSGSTLLDRLLGQLTGWWSLGEVLQVWRRGVIDNELCGCGEHFSTCPIWSSIGDVAFGGWDRHEAMDILGLKESVERDRYIPQLLMRSPGDKFGTRLSEYNALLTRLYSAVREVTGATTVVDSGKHVSAALVLAHNPDADLRIVHLVRDSRGVAHSSNKVLSRPSTDNDELMYRMSPLETSIRYVAYNSILASKFRDERFRLRYEDLVSQPDHLIGELCRWATHGQCDHGAHVADPLVLDAGHGISGNPQRMRTGPTLLRIDDEWRRSMTFGHRMLVTSLTAPSLLYDHYPLSFSTSPGPALSPRPLPHDTD